MNLDCKELGKKVAYIVAASEIVQQGSSLPKHLEGIIALMLRNDAMFNELTASSLMVITKNAVEFEPSLADKIHNVMLFVVAQLIDGQDVIAINGNRLLIPAVSLLAETMLENDKERFGSKNMLKERLKLGSFLFARSGISEVYEKIMDSDNFDFEKSSDSVMVRLLKEAELAKKLPYYEESISTHKRFYIG